MISPVFMRRSDDGEICLYDDRDEFMACFKSGKWVNDLIFSDFALEEFHIVEDEEVIWPTLEQARSALGKPLEQ